MSSCHHRRYALLRVAISFAKLADTHSAPVFALDRRPDCAHAAVQSELKSPWINIVIIFKELIIVAFLWISPWVCSVIVAQIAFSPYRFQSFIHLTDKFQIPRIIYDTFFDIFIIR